MLPLSLISRAVDRVGGEIVPRWLGPRDERWLGALLDEHERHVGRRRAELLARLAEPLAVRCPKPKLDLAIAVLERLSPARVRDEPRPREVRAVAFRAAVRVGVASALAETARLLRVEPEEVDALLFADLPGERRVGSLGALTPAELAAETNLALAGALLSRAQVVRVRAADGAEAIVRRARRLGLVCAVADASCELEVSGPFSLFRRTTLYGRALASFIPELASCDGWSLSASCALPPGRDARVFSLRAGQLPVPRTAAPAEHPVVARLATDLAALRPAWRVARDPAPVRVGGALVFPDLEIRTPEQHAPWFVEIAGFWTRATIEERAAIEQLILCVDAGRGCDETVPAGARVVRYGRRVDARAVAAIVEGAASVAERQP